MSEIPPPPRSPKETLTPPGLPRKLKKWAGVASAIVTIGGAALGVWKVIDYIDDLHDTIGANKTEVSALRTQLDEDHDALAGQIGQVATAIRTAREADQEVITNLRIAVAALQAAQDVRAGRVSYGGVEDNRLALAQPVRPPTARARREQAAQAEEDASAALTRAARAQRTADEEDPLAALDGL
jgi:hypothetical protein